MKNRMRETCKSGSVRGGDGDIPTYSALGAAQRRERGVEGAFLGERGEVAEEGQAATARRSSAACRAKAKQSWCRYLRQFGGLATPRDAWRRRPQCSRSNCISAHPSGAVLLLQSGRSFLRRK